MKALKLSKWKLWLFRILAPFVALFIGLILGEILIRLIAPQDLSGTWFERSPRGNKINRANWTVRHQNAGRVQEYHFNDQRLRGGPIEPATNRVLCVGDSFTMGWLLAEKDTYVRKLGERAAQDFPANAFTFLNGGASSYGTADCVAFVEDFAPVIQPSVLLVFLNLDDVARNEGGVFQLDTNAPGMIRPMSFDFHQAPFRDSLQASGIYQWLLTHSHLLQLVRHAVKSKLDRGHEEDRAAEQKAARAAAMVKLEEALLLRLRDWCRTNQCRLLVVTTGFNAFSDFPLGAFDRSPNEDFFAEASSICAANGIAFHDLGPEMKQATGGDFKPLVIPRDFHPNERGSEMIAALAWPWLKEQLQQVLETPALARSTK